MLLRQPESSYRVCGPLTKNRKKYKNVKKQGIQNTFIKTNKVKPASNMI